MFIRTLDQRLSSQASSVSKPVQIAALKPKRRKYYPMRILARVFAIIGMATAVYATTLVGIFVNSGIIAL